MRLNQFIPEASVFTRGTYTYGHLVRTAADNKEGVILIKKIQDVVDSDFNPGEVLKWVPAPKSLKGVPIVPFKSSNNVKYFERENGQIFGVQGGDSSIQSALNHADKYNRGDIAEAILGATLTAKLIKRGSDKIGQIDISDIQAVLGKAINKGQELIYRVEDKNSQIADVIEYTLRLPSGSMIAIQDKGNWAKFKDLFSSALEYSNSSDINKYANFFYQNGKVDEILITSDGVSGQKDRKTDVIARVKDQKTGQFKDLKNVDISLKADSNIYHQHSSGGLTKGKNAWLSSAKALFEPLGITVDMPAKGVNNIATFWTAIYKQVATKLDMALKGANANKETMFIEKLAEQIAKHATRDNKNLKLISFFKSSYSIHSFNILKQRLIVNNIDLGAELKIGPRSGKPSIEIFDRNSGELLTAVRFYLSDTASTNYWEKGPLLHELTRIVKEKNVPDIEPSSDVAAAPEAPPVEPPAPTQTFKAPTAQKPGFVAPKLKGKTVNTLKGDTWQSPDEVDDDFEKKRSVSVEEDLPDDKDVFRLKKLAGIKSTLSKGI